MGTAFIVDAIRTAGGKRDGALKDWHPVDLGAAVLDSLIERTGIDPAAIDDVIVGCVGQIGEQAFHVGRNMVLASSLPETVPAVTIDRQCGSSQQSVHFAAQAVMSGTQDLVIAAGVESMTRVPMGSPVFLPLKAGIGTGPWPRSVQERFGVSEFTQFRGAEMMAKKYGLSRDDLDAFALASHRKAAEATRARAFADEIVPLKVDDGEHLSDEGIRHDSSLEGLAGLKTLVPDGVITAGNASQICDGAAAVLIASEAAVKTHGLKPLARIDQLTVTAGDPVIMLDEPIRATGIALEKAGRKLGAIDLYEVNEAFAPVPLSWLQQLGGDPQKLNVHGGAIALGHPLGASGAKLMATLVHALYRHGGRLGLQTMCEGGGIANVTIIERL
jgi:acetyl-CoA C-acetyltransferase